MARKLLLIFFLALFTISFFLLSSLILKTRPDIRQLIPSKIIGTPSKITLLSEVPSIKIVSYDKKALNEMFDQFGFFQPLATVYYTSSGMPVKKITLSSITIRLTNKDQPLGQVLSSGEGGQEYIYQTFGFEYVQLESLNETYDLNLYLQVHKDLIEKETAEDLEKRFLYQLLTATWSLTHPYLSTYESFEERLVGLDEFVEKEMQKDFFKITKI